MDGPDSCIGLNHVTQLAIDVMTASLLFEI